MARSTRKPPRKPPAKGHPPAVRTTQKKRQRAITPPVTRPKTVRIEGSVPMGLKTLASVSTPPSPLAPEPPSQELPPGRSSQELPPRPKARTTIEVTGTPMPARAISASGNQEPPTVVQSSAAEPPGDVTTVQNTGVLSGTASGIGSAFGTLTARVALPPEWTAQRNEIARQLADIQSALGEIRPFVEFIERSIREPKRDGRGGNNPPGPIDEPPIGTNDLAEISAAVGTLSSLDQEGQAAAPIQLSHLALKRAGPKVGAFSEWIKTKGNLFVDEFIKGAASQAGKRTVDALYLMGAAAILASTIGLILSRVEQLLQVLHLLP